MSLELKNEDKWISIDPRSDKLLLRFRVRGFPKQFQISTGLKDLKRNRDIVRLRRDAIATDILLGHFDSTLERYQFKPSQIATPLISLLPKGEGDLGELWEMFTEFQSRQIEATTIYSTYRVVSRTIDRLPSRSLLDLQISISRSKNLLGIEKGTKNGKSRIFQCSAGAKLHELLLSMKPTASGDSRIFSTKRGCPMTSSALSHAWNRDGKNQTGVVRKLSNQEIIPYLNPYATRHTFATWAIASGNSPDRVAYWIGDDVNTVLRYYVHPEATKGECPDF
ncbi:tyrosine-type recombinase/integrase [Nostoc flagelliforme]|uniref:tyrosine-type recombinase/integrase n=1 Tax=Nostoc flagelliforme TaxID=1306274 RepID=UPI001CEC0A42|nr:tyrosine-type recombinase/integrase [Nostoc flagelliforme]